VTIHEALEEAFEQLGLSMDSGYDIRTARRSLLLCLKKWASRGLNFWQLEEYSLSLVAGTRSYAMVEGTIDLVLASVKYGSGTSEINISPPLSLAEYHGLPNKTQTGKPVNYMVHREQRNAIIYLWPVPDSSSYTLHGFRQREDGVEDANDESLEVPSRFEPALIADLAYELSLKKVGDPARRAEMRDRAAMLWSEAERGDAMRQTIRFVPVVRW
jgi:hypothetical protein